MLAVGLALALLRSGWELHAHPGVFHFQKGTEQLNPFGMVPQLVDGKLTREAWASRSRERGIATHTLFPQDRADCGGLVRKACLSGLNVCGTTASDLARALLESFDRDHY